MNSKAVRAMKERSPKLGRSKSNELTRPTKLPIESEETSRRGATLGAPGGWGD